MIPSWVDPSLYPFEPRRFEVDGHAMSYVDEGAGEPVVLVHGTPTWSFLWRDAIRALSRGHRVVADGEGFRREEGWVFNSLTYLWAKRSLWEGNRLATPGTWSQDGRIWRTECDTAATGRGACRTWLRQPTVEVVDGQPRAGVEWVFNNQVLFS